MVVSWLAFVIVTFMGHENDDNKANLETIHARFWMKQTFQEVLENSIGLNIIYKKQ